MTKSGSITSYVRQTELVFQYLFHRLECAGLRRVPRLDAHRRREAVMVHEQPRLYKGQRTALFAVAKPHQSAFLLTSSTCHPKIIFK